MDSKTLWRLNLTGSVYSPNYHLQGLSDDFNALSLPQQYIRTYNVSISASEVIPPAPAKSGLPGWAIALIVVGSVLFVAGISYLIFKKYQARKAGTYLRMSNNDSIAQGTSNGMD